MEKNEMPNSHLQEEHTFDEISKRIKQIHEKLASETGIEHADQYLREICKILRDLDKLEEEKRDEEIRNEKIKIEEIKNEEVKKLLNDERRKQRERIGKWIVLILLIVFFSFIYAWLVTYSQFKFIIDKIGFLAIIATTAIDFFLARPNIGHYSRSEGEKVIDGLWHVTKELIKTFKRTSFLHLMAIIVIVAAMGGMIKKANLLDTLSKLANGEVQIVMVESNRMVADMGNSDRGDERVLAGGNEILIDLLINMEITADEKEQELFLSLYDYNAIFFQDNFHELSDQDSQEKFDEVVKEFVNYLLEKENENLFDKPEEAGGAPENVRRDISEASEKEEQAHSFREVVKILEVRQSIYILYPKKSLANLISNGYHKLAYMLYVNQGNRNSMVYYYGQSILYDFEYLSFAGNDGKQIRERLLKIAQRYRDIAYVYPDYAAFGIAEKLAIAFENAAAQY